MNFFSYGDHFSKGKQSSTKFTLQNLHSGNWHGQIARSCHIGINLQRRLPRHLSSLSPLSPYVKSTSSSNPRISLKYSQGFLCFLRNKRLFHMRGLAIGGVKYFRYLKNRVTSEQQREHQLRKEQRYKVILDPSSVNLSAFRLLGKFNHKKILVQNSLSVLKVFRRRKTNYKNRNDSWSFSGDLPFSSKEVLFHDRVPQLFVG